MTHILNNNISFIRLAEKNRTDWVSLQVGSRSSDVWMKIEWDFWRKMTMVKLTIDLFFNLLIEGRTYMCSTSRSTYPTQHTNKRRGMRFLLLFYRRHVRDSRLHPAVVVKFLQRVGDHYPVWLTDHPLR